MTINRTLLIVLMAIMGIMTLFCQCAKDEVETTGNINGIVTDVATGEPISNVSIALSPTGKTTVTGSDGSYEFIDLEPQPYKIQAMHANYKTNTKSVTVYTGEVVRGDMQMAEKE